MGTKISSVLKTHSLSFGGKILAEKVATGHCNEKNFNKIPTERNEHEFFWAIIFVNPQKCMNKKKTDFTGNQKMPERKLLAFICLLLLMEERAVSLDCCIYCYQINNSSVDFHFEMSIIKKIDLFARLM